MTTMVVPLDGSAFAERAIRPACSIAARLDPAEVLLAIAATEPDGMLCMATRGKGVIRAKVLGSVSTTVVCGSTQPFILVGPNCRTTLLPAERGRFLVCSDGSALSDSIIPVAATWGSRLQLEPWLTEVVGPDEDPEPAHRPHPNREAEAAKERLSALATRLQTPTSRARTRVLHGAPGRSIPWLAERLPAALIALATHGHSGLTRITMGSVATEVVRHARVSTLLRRMDKQTHHTGHMQETTARTPDRALH